MSVLEPLADNNAVSSDEVKCVEQKVDPNVDNVGLPGKAARPRSRRKRQGPRAGPPVSTCDVPNGSCAPEAQEKGLQDSQQGEVEQKAKKKQPKRQRGGQKNKNHKKDQTTTPESKAILCKSKGPGCPAIKTIRFEPKEDELKEELFIGHAVTYHVPHSRNYDEKSVAIMNKYHPCELKDVFRYNCYNEHPLCAFFRVIAEAHVITRLQSELKDKDIRFGRILDVGGAVNRHHGNGRRKFIHSCVPYFEAKDLMRKFSLKGDKFCHCQWQKCRCHRYLASMSVHSLYYITPLDILICLLRQEVPIHYAVLHRYPKTLKGEIMYGEMQYERNGSEITVLSKGNTTPYRHSAMDWLDDNSFVGPYGTLVWEKERDFGDVLVYRFIASPHLFPLPQKPIKIEEETIVSPHPYMEFINAADRPNLPINKANRDAFLQRVLRKAGDDANRRELISMADKFYFESKPVLREADSSTFFKAAYIDKALAFQSEHKHWLVLLFASAIMSIIPSLVPFLFDVTYFLTCGFVLTALMAKRGLLITERSSYSFGNWLLCLSLFFTMVMLVHFELYAMLEEMANQSILPKYLVIGLTTLILYKSFEVLSFDKIKLYDYCCQGLQLRELSKTKVIKYRPKKNMKECVPGVRAYPMVFHPEYIPFIPRRCDHNYHACIQHKVLNVTNEDYVFDLPIPSVFYNMANGIKEVLKPLSFEEWVSRFPPQKEQRLRSEYKEMEQVVIDDHINDSNLFLKAEFYPELKPPRPIHSSSVVLNYMVGRWLVPLAELFSSSLPEHLCFPLHNDSYLVGKFAENYIEQIKIMSDFSMFDSSQHSKALRFICDVFGLFGVPKNVLNLMMLDTSCIRVSTRKGHKYKAKGIRCSGRSETLLGNTILTMSVFLHVFEGNLLALLAKGDDIVAFLKYMVDTERVRERIYRLGFLAKLFQVDKYDLEFCSSYFIPCNKGLMLVPKPGKILAKVLWCKNTNFKQHEIEEQFVGILKGMRQTIGWIPGIRGLYENPLYARKYNQVEGIRGEYNEYTEEIVEGTAETLTWILVKYDIGYEQLMDLESELKKCLPISLTSVASEAMIEMDWGVSSGSEFLKNETETTNYFDLVWNVLVEESIRWLHPIWFSIMIGLYESYSNRNVYNLLAHITLGFVALDFGIVAAFMLHLLHNLLVSRGRKLDMRNKKQSQGKLLNQIASLKGQVRKNGKSGKQRKKVNKSNGKSGINMYANMLRDPCGCDLINGLHSTDEGILAKLKTSETPGVTDEFGYVLWCPHYCGNVGDKKIQCVGFATTSAANGPLNTVAEPAYSVGWWSPRGVTVTAGANQFVNSSTVSDFRLVSACIKATYTGTMSSSKGQIAYIENLPADTLLLGNGGAPSTVDQLFNLSSHTMRCGVDDHEIRYRPNPTVTSTFKSDRDSVYTLGTPGASTTVLTSEALRFSPTYFGFAWRGVISSDLFFEFFQNIEWRPEAGSGYVNSVPRQLKPAGYLEQVLKYLDDTAPGWTVASMNMAGYAAKQVSKMALTGAKSYGIKLIL